MLDRNLLREALVAGVAELEGYAADEIETVIAGVGGLGGYELDSKQAEWIIAHVEYALGLDTPLPKPADLLRGQFATLDALLDLILTVTYDGTGYVDLH